MTCQRRRSYRSTRGAARMRQSDLRAACVRVAAVPHPGRDAGWITGSVSLEQRLIGLSQFEVPRLRDTHGQGVDAERDQDDTLGRAGHHAVGAAERRERSQLAVDEGGDDYG